MELNKIKLRIGKELVILLNKINLLCIQAGQDGRSQGACPFCQDVFIQLLIKAQT